MKNLANGEIDELKYLYDNMARPVYYLALSILKDISLAEDVLQDTFLKVYEKAESCRKNPRAWIMSIARNIALNKMKKSKHESTSFDDVEGAFYDTDNSFLALNEAFKDLTEVEEQIVVLYVFGGFKQKEIADIVSLSYPNVRKKYRSAISKLKKYFKEA